MSSLIKNGQRRTFFLLVNNCSSGLIPAILNMEKTGEGMVQQMQPGGKKERV